MSAVTHKSKAVTARKPRRDKQKSFFSLRSQEDVVVDAVCSCGHLQSAHGSVCRRVTEDLILREPHDGNCCAGGCECREFEWSRWTTAEEVVANSDQKFLTH